MVTDTRALASRDREIREFSLMSRFSQPLVVQMNGFKDRAQHRVLCEQLELLRKFSSGTSTLMDKLMKRCD